MGTNYYVHTSGCADACKHGCPAAEEIHLGKSSVGWRFLHRADPDWPREEAYSLWLQRARSGEIRDEYGQPVPLEDLLEFIRSRQTGREHGTADLPLWFEASPELAASLRASDFTCDGFDFCDREFC